MPPGAQEAIPLAFFWRRRSITRGPAEMIQTLHGEGVAGLAAGHLVTENGDVGSYCGLRVEVADVVVGTRRSPRIRNSGAVKSERKGAVLTKYVFESVSLVVPTRGEIVLNGLQSRFNAES